MATEALKVNAGYCAGQLFRSALSVRHRLLRKRRVAMNDLVQRTVAEDR